MPVYGIEVSVGASVGLIGAINDVPFVQKRGSDAFAGSLPIQLDVMPGGNQVMLSIIPRNGRAGTAPVTLPIDKQMFVTAKVQAGTATGDPSPRSVTVHEVTRVEWDPEKRAVTQVVLPHSLSLGFSASDIPGEPIWARAAILGPEFDREAMEQIQHLLELLRSQNVDGFADAVYRKYEDVARAFPAAGNAARQRWIDVQELGDLIRQPHITWSDPSTLGPFFPRYANGRIIDCLARDGRPLIRGQARGAKEPILVSVMLASLGGHLVPVR